MTPSTPPPLHLAAAQAAATLLATYAAVLPLHASQEVVIVKGEAGEAKYLVELDATVQLWRRAAEKAGHALETVEPSNDETPQLERLRTHLARVQSPSEDPLWIVLAGHGNAQGKAPRFALKGPDLTADDLSKMLHPIKRPVILVGGFACSGAFISPLAGPNRVLVSATRSGREDNWVRFPKLFAEAMTSLDADMDADGAVSVFEAWLHASRAVASYYRQEGRMLTEHSVLSEPDAARPLEYSAFESKAKEAPKAIIQTEVAPHSSRWHLVASPIEALLSPQARVLRERLETEIAALRKFKDGLLPEEYQAQLEALLLKLSALYDSGTEVPQ